MKLNTILAAGLLLPLVGTGAASAQFAQSEYTDINLNQCTVVQSDDFGSTWACGGHKGMPVMIAESKLRFSVSFGLTSTVEKAAAQTLPPTNHLGDKIEWRLSNAAGGYKPVAAIVRYITQKLGDDDKVAGEGQVLVVTKIEPGATCQIAWIDALANTDAEELARKAADEKAVGFDCAKEPEIIGKFEAWKR